MKTAKNNLFFTIVAFLFSCCGGGGMEDFQKFEKQLTPEKQREVASFQREHTFHRKIEREFSGSLEIFEYLLNHFSFMSASMKVLKIRGYFIEKSEKNHYSFRDGENFTGKIIEYLKIPGQRLYRVHVQKDPPGLFSLKADLLLSSRYENLPEKKKVACHLQAWVRLHGFAAVLAKIFIPLGGRIFDRKVTEITEGCEILSKKINEHPREFLKKIRASQQISQKDIDEIKTFLLKIGKLKNLETSRE
jgi:hypothetical protein